MTANMTTANNAMPNRNAVATEDWASLVLVSSVKQVRRVTPTPAARLTAAEIERADYEAARQLGQQRRMQANGMTEQQAKAAKEAAGRGWLAGDPRQWRGRQIRNRNNQSLYSIRQVFNSGRVELQRTFMLYISDVATIRKDYSPA